MRAVAGAGEAADDLGAAADGCAGAAGAGEVGAVAAGVGAGEVACAFAGDAHSDGVVIVGIGIFEHEDGVDDGVAFACRGDDILILRRAGDGHGERARAR
ncbi:MAG: hypothetical protein GC206_06465 [Alphaproteobacteria bacterium]|nr:hypothetical protein [Alphaproteobacteria bacterium]